MATPIFALCDQYIHRLCTLDPVLATSWGITGDFGTGTDYGPDGLEARAALVRETLRELRELTPTGGADRVAASHLRERLEATLAWHDAGEPLRFLRAPFGLVQSLRNHVELMPRQTGADWAAVADRLAAFPAMLGSWRAALGTGADRGLLAARRQAVEAATQAEEYAARATFAPLLGRYPGGAEAQRLAAGETAAYAALRESAQWLRREYAPRAVEADGVGPDRYAVASRLALGDTIDPYEAYDWAWQELRRLEAELAAEADRIRSGATVDEVIAELNGSAPLAGTDAYREWLTERHLEAIEALHGVHFDIPEPLRRVDVVTVDDPGAGSAYYTPPSEDLSRPGRTWWPVAGRERFAVWAELTTVFHEGVPGHHLERGQARLPGDRISRFGRLAGVSGHSEGWALYAERLADELGWHERSGSTGTRLGMLKGSAMRAARVVIDIGLHLDLPLPEPEAARHGPRWTFDTALAVLRDRGRIAAHRLRPEVVRYCGWPGQATAYKLGERSWLAARQEARRRLGAGFDLKRWHTAALSMGPVGLAELGPLLAAVDDHRPG